MGLTKEPLDQAETILSNGKPFIFKLGKSYRAVAEDYHGLPGEEGILYCASIYRYPDGYKEINLEIREGKLEPGPVQNLKSVEEIL